MNKSKVVAGGLILVAVMFMCAIAFGQIAPQKVDPSKDSIDMINPNGWLPGRDAQYAEHVNQPNSEANRNNSEANYNNAQATHVVGDTVAQKAKYVGAGIGGTWMVVLTSVALLLLFVMFRK